MNLQPRCLNRTLRRQDSVGSRNSLKSGPDGSGAALQNLPDWGWLTIARQRLGVRLPIRRDRFRYPSGQLRKISRLGSQAALIGFLLCGRLALAETFRVSTYNVENYLDAPTQTRHVKSPEAKAKVRESILAMKPDVLALEEIGTVSALQELRESLRAEGLDFPYWEYVTGYDTNIHVAVLSRFPFTARRPHTNDNFLLSGRRFQVSRGFAEVDVQVNTNYSFTMIAAHLKSKRPCMCKRASSSSSFSSSSSILKQNQEEKGSRTRKRRRTRRKSASRFTFHVSRVTSPRPQTSPPTADDPIPLPNSASSPHTSHWSPIPAPCPG